MANLATRSPVALARPLTVLVPLIKQELVVANDDALKCYQKAGELLREAKVQVQQQGKVWHQWLDKNFHLSQTTARTYIRLADEKNPIDVITEGQSNQQYTSHPRAAASQPREIRTLSDLVDTGHRPAWFAPVQEVTNRLDVAKIKREYEDKQKENKVKRDLAFQLIDIGFKVLATKLHPDKGGSAEAMGRLSEIKSALKSFTEDKWTSR